MNQGVFESGASPRAAAFAHRDDASSENSAPPDGASGAPPRNESHPLPIDPDLLRVVAAWSSLSPAAKTAVLAVLRIEQPR